MLLRLIMNHSKPLSRIVFKQLWLVIFCILFFPLSVFASSQLENLPTYSFAEFNIAFILGLSLPLLIIMALLKPILKVKWRYPALLTISLLFQFYAFSSLSQWQTPALLISASIFVLTSFLWLQSGLTQHVLTKTFAWLVAIVCFCYMSAVAFIREADVFQLWLALLGVIFIATAFTVKKSQANKNTTLRAATICCAIACYGVALYLWV